MPHLAVKYNVSHNHYLQEDNPEEIGKSILEWNSKIS